MARAAHEDLDERSLHRVLFFTDAVFAIVMTLLVLELRPPEAGDQLAVLEAMRPKFFAFAMSFGILALFWVAHMATTKRLKTFDWPSAAANLVFLFPVCLIPFVSAWMGEAMGSSLSWGAYSAVLVATSAANVALVLVQSRGGGRLLAGGMTGRERIYRVGRAASPGLAFVVGLGAAVAGQVHLAQFCWVLIPVFMGLCRLLKPKAA